MAESEPETEATGSSSVRIELGGLVISVEGAPNVDTAARVVLGLLAKLEPLAKRGVVGFYPNGAPQTELRPQPDLTWNGSLWGGSDD
jgi:hypothetical protein